jgi:hypothetical protein
MRFIALPLKNSEQSLLQVKNMACLQLTKIANHFKKFDLVLRPANERHQEQLFLFALDEARTITAKDLETETFYNFRCVLREICKFSIFPDDHKDELKYFGLFLDTHGSISNFLPKDRPRDPSFRKFEGEDRLFPPLFILQFRRETVENWWIAKDLNASTTVISEMLMNQGRYLWKAFHGGSTIEEDIRFGCQKLLGGKDYDSTFSIESLLPISMAILGSRIAVTFHCTERYNTDMVSSHMGVCYFMEPDQGMMIYGYPSEPLLSLSAAFLLKRSNFNWTACLKNILPFLRKGLVGAGVRGELIGRILLSMAWDSCQLKPFHNPVQISVFLEKLGGHLLLNAFRERGTKQQQDEILNGHLYFTHFVYVSYEVNQVYMLEHFLARGQAVLCRNNQQAIDLLVPIVLSDGHMVSFIAIQCRNRKKISWVGARKKYDATKMGFSKDYVRPYLVLCMQFGKGGRRAVTNLMPESPELCGVKNIIAMNGLDESVFPILKDIDGLKSLLENLQVSWEDPLSYFENQDGRDEEGNLLKTVMEPTYELESWHLDEDDPMDTTPL